MRANTPVRAMAVGTPIGSRAHGVVQSVYSHAPVSGRDNQTMLRIDARREGLNNTLGNPKQLRYKGRVGVVLIVIHHHANPMKRKGRDILSDHAVFCRPRRNYADGRGEGIVELRDGLASGAVPGRQPVHGA